MLQTLRHPYVLLALTAMFWGGNAVAGKLAVGHVSPMVLTFLRWLLALLAILPFAWPRIREDWPTVRENALFLFAIGALGMTAFNAILYLALTHTSAVQATIVQSAMPLVVFLGTFLFFRARPSGLQFIGFSLTAVGVMLAATRGEPAALFELSLNRGDAMMLVAVLIYGGYTVALAYKPKLHWLTMGSVLAAGALLASVPLLVAEIATGAATAPDDLGWLIVIYTALLPSIAAQALYIRGVELIGGNRANLFINLVPLFGALFAVLVLGEALLPYHFIALALVVGGILLAERVKARRSAP